MGNRGAESDWPYQGAIDVAASFGANMEAMVSSEKGYLKQFCEPGMIYSVSDPNYFKHVKINVEKNYKKEESTNCHHFLKESFHYTGIYCTSKVEKKWNFDNLIIYLLGTGRYRLTVPECYLGPFTVKSI